MKGRIVKSGSARVVIGKNVTVVGTLKIIGDGEIYIEDDVVFDQHNGANTLVCSRGAALTVGGETYVNGAQLVAQKEIRLGERCLLGDCLMMDSDFHHVDIDRLSSREPLNDAPIVCGDNVWIANRAIILKGVTIGENSVVGAGAVVRSDVPPNVVVIGNPQIIVKRLAV